MHGSAGGGLIKHGDSSGPPHGPTSAADAPGATPLARVPWLPVASSAAACSRRPPDTPRLRDAHRGRTRATKDDVFPDVIGLAGFREPEGRALLPLVYYPVDPSYNVPAALKPSDDRTTIMMPTSAGTEDPMRRVGTLEFTLKGQPMTLAAFAPAAARTVDRLFVPFRDLTSGKETYPAGRYLDLDRTATGIYQLDFNRAYNPNCYFDLKWICPLPPRENSLQIAVLAGERIKEKG